SIDGNQARQLEFVGIGPTFFRLNHDTGYGVNDDDSGIRYTQCSARFLDEISESRGVEHVDLVLVPLAERELRRDSDLSFDLFFVVIGRGIPVVYTPEAIRRTRIEQNRRNERSLAAAPVPDDADIANV